MAWDVCRCRIGRGYALLPWSGVHAKPGNTDVAQTSSVSACDDKNSIAEQYCLFFLA